MSENQSNIDREAIDLQEEAESREGIFSEEEYFIVSLNSVSSDILPDEFYNRNKQLIRNMANDLCDRHNRQGDMPPELAGRCIEVFFSSITKFGLR